MSKEHKKAVRQKFNDACLARDNYMCRVCGAKSNTNSGLVVPLDVHHITSRKDMPGGGYVKENGISLCGLCHYSAEVNQIQPSFLYKLIDSSYEKALEASERDCRSTN